MLALTIIPGVAVLGAIFTGFKAIEPRLKVWSSQKREALAEKRRAAAIKAIYAQMPLTALSHEAVQEYQSATYEMAA